MKATITTKNRTVVSGEVTLFGSAIIAINVNELSATKAIILADEDVTMSKYSTYWHIQIPRRIISAMTIED